jgi:hypothetical protein
VRKGEIMAQSGLEECAASRSWNSVRVTWDEFGDLSKENGFLAKRDP